jgi:multidrug efflux system outer membrane protein
MSGAASGAANEAAQATLLASQYSRDAIRLSIAGLVSNTYLALRAYDAQLGGHAETAGQPRRPA